MKRLFWLLLAFPLLLSACQPRATPVTLLADGQVYTLATATLLPADILAEAGITLEPADRLLYLGSQTPLDAALPDADSYTLTVRRAVTLVVTTPDGEPWPIQTSAQTVGQAMAEAGLDLHAADRLDPPADTPLTGDMYVFWQPASELTITVDGAKVQVRSAAPTVGQALAEAGFPLIGLDYSLPSENEPLPADGQIRIVRVVESVALTQKSIPYGTRTELSADLEIDQQALVQGGETGLAIARLRTRAEDGEQVSQVSETESVVRPPQDQILGIGTKIVIRTAEVDGVTIEYWRALSLFATYYKPCGAGQPRCYYGTASGTLVRKGAVAMVYPWYLLFAGEHLYIPGYGFGIVEDNNGAYTNTLGDTYWVDLGYAQEDEVDWVNQYVTVYFLTPVPANVADTYLLP
ncbi:MAG: DUF348 domain-containing protein [Chloroflexi bacterium]|nr:DUF348 domain-containing protein [Chloroflexota bacterium]